VREKRDVNRKVSGAPILDGRALLKPNGAATPSDADPSRLQRLQSLPLKFLRFHAVRDRTGLSRSTIWRLERRGEFPKHRRISANAVGWVEQEINEWMLGRAVNG
jgi:prophage regulatory protein